MIYRQERACVISRTTIVRIAVLFAVLASLLSCGAISAQQRQLDSGPPAISGSGSPTDDQQQDEDASLASSSAQRIGLSEEVIAVSPSRQLAVVVEDGRTFTVIDLQSMSVKTRLVGSGLKGLQSAAFCGDERYLWTVTNEQHPPELVMESVPQNLRGSFTPGRDSRAIKWDLETGEAVHALAPRDSCVRTVRSSADGSQLLVTLDAARPNKDERGEDHVEIDKWLFRIESDSGKVLATRQLERHTYDVCFAAGTSRVCVLDHPVFTGDDSVDGPVFRVFNPELKRPLWITPIGSGLSQDDGPSMPEVTRLVSHGDWTYVVYRRELVEHTGDEDGNEVSRTVLIDRFDVTRKRRDRWLKFAIETVSDSKLPNRFNAKLSVLDDENDLVLSIADEDPAVDYLALENLHEPPRWRTFRYQGAPEPKLQQLFADRVDAAIGQQTVLRGMTAMDLAIGASRRVMSETLVTNDRNSVPELKRTNSWPVGQIPGQPVVLIESPSEYRIVDLRSRQTLRQFGKTEASEPSVSPASVLDALPASLCAWDEANQRFVVLVPRELSGGTMPLAKALGPTIQPPVIPLLGFQFPAMPTEDVLNKLSPIEAKLLTACLLGYDWQLVFLPLDRETPTFTGHNVRGPKVDLAVEGTDILIASIHPLHQGISLTVSAGGEPFRTEQIFRGRPNSYQSVWALMRMLFDDEMANQPKQVFNISGYPQSMTHLSWIAHGFCRHPGLDLSIEDSNRRRLTVVDVMLFENSHIHVYSQPSPQASWTATHIKISSAKNFASSIGSGFPSFKLDPMLERTLELSEQGFGISDRGEYLARNIRVAGDPEERIGGPAPSQSLNAPLHTSPVQSDISIIDMQDGRSLDRLNIARIARHTFQKQLDEHRQSRPLADDPAVYHRDFNLSPDGRFLSVQVVSPTNKTIVVNRATREIVAVSEGTTPVFFMDDLEHVVFGETALRLEDGQPAVWTQSNLIANTSQERPSSHNEPEEHGSKRTSTVFFLGMGVDEYRNDRIPTLTFAASDVRHVNDALQKICQQTQRRYMSRMILNERATVRVVETELRGLRHLIQPEDVLVLAFSCHGITQHRGLYLTTHETNPSLLQGTALNWSTVASELEKMSAGQTLVFLDACHSGGFGSTTTNLFQDLNQRLQSKRGLMIISSSQEDEFSFEDSSLAQGIFTHCLVTKLRDMVNQQVSASRFFQDLSGMVADLSKDGQHCRLIHNSVDNTKSLQLLLSE